MTNRRTTRLNMTTGTGRAILVMAVLLSGPTARADAPGDRLWQAGRFVVQPEVELTYSVRGSGGIRASGVGFLGDLSVARALTDRVLLGIEGMIATTRNPSYEGAGGPVCVDRTAYGLWGVGPVLSIRVADAAYLSFAGWATWASWSAPGVSADSDVGVGGRVSLGRQWRTGPVHLGVFLSAFASQNTWASIASTTLGAGGGLSVAFN